MTKVIAVLNQKGGVGKTTTCVNLGAALSEKGFNVLLLDLDPLGNMTGWLADDSGDYPVGIGELLCGESAFEETVKKASNFNIDFVPAGKNLRVILAKRYIDSYALKERLSASIEKYQFVIIDCPPSSDALVKNALLLASSLIIPIQTETLPLQSGIKFLEWLEEFKKDFNSSIDIMGILPCMFDSRTRLSNQILDAMRGSEHLGPMVFNTIIRKNIRLAETPGSGKSIFKSASTSYGANDYINLALEVITKSGYEIPQNGDKPYAHSGSGEEISHESMEFQAHR